jgi:1-acyl-sn-glycerol-3-phosphate acyltransferase
MAKKELFRIPVFGWGIRVLGHLPVDRSRARKARESILAAVRKVRGEDISLLVFPEGTRSVTGELGEFKPASFALAIEAGVEVLPIALSGTHRILGKKSWRIRPGKIGLSIGMPISLDHNRGMSKKDLSEKVYEALSSLKRQYENMNG